MKELKRPGKKELKDCIIMCKKCGDKSESEDFNQCHDLHSPYIKSLLDRIERLERWLEEEDKEAIVVEKAHKQQLIETRIEELDKMREPIVGLETHESLIFILHERIAQLKKG